MKASEACAHVTRRLGRTAIGAEPLTGGLLNHVFRVRLQDGGSVVVKHAPPFVASAPHIPLDPGRSAMEASALAFLDGHGVPRLLDAAPPVLILEDLGDLPDLADHLSRGGSLDLLTALGRWLRLLHDGPAPVLDNRSVQQTRLQVQYAAAEGWLEALGLPDAQPLGAELRDLGMRFLAGGPHFVMGDLWPPSVRVRHPGGLVVLDWELATRGHRAQDLGHLAAHLELDAAVGRLPPGLPDVFLDAYGPLTPREARDTALHRAAELLARTVGAFPRTDLDDALRHRLVQSALHRLRSAQTGPR